MTFVENKLQICARKSDINKKINHNDFFLWKGDVEKFLDEIPEEQKLDLVVTSPPYNIGKEYEKQVKLEKYLEWQEQIITKIVPHLSDNGSLCWQVGNYVDNGEVLPLDIELHPIFRKFGLKLRNRIVWTFGHGLHCKKRFSGRYEVVLWYTRSDNYVFNLDPIRVPAKYPGKKHYKGPNAGKLSGNPLGKNPEDVWDIPNVKSNHIEKTDHPCQFPVGLIQRLILGLTNEGDVVFDPFSGVGTSGVAAAITGRKFIGCEIEKKYTAVAETRINEALRGEAKYRPHDKPLYDHTKSNLSKGSL